MIGSRWMITAKWIPHWHQGYSFCSRTYAYELCWL